MVAGMRRRHRREDRHDGINLSGRARYHLTIGGDSQAKLHPTFGFGLVMNPEPTPPRVCRSLSVRDLSAIAQVAITDSSNATSVQPVFYS